MILISSLLVKAIHAQVKNSLYSNELSHLYQFGFGDYYLINIVSHKIIGRRRSFRTFGIGQIMGGVKCWEIINYLHLNFLDSDRWVYENLLTYTAWKVSKYGVFSGPYFPAFALNTERYEVSNHVSNTVLVITRIYFSFVLLIELLLFLIV